MAVNDLVLRIIGDATSYFKTADSVVATNTKIGESALAMGRNFTKAAEAQIAAGTKSIQVQRAMVAELTAGRAKLVAGTDEAIAADVALERAQANLNRTMGVSAASYAGVGRGAQTAERDLSKLTRGALAGSGVISSLGRSLAFASSGFIAVAGTATLLHNAITEALAFTATEKQVTAQLKTSGLSFEQNKSQILDNLTAQSKLSAFTRGDLLQSFGYLVRVSGDVDQSLKLTSIAADVARGRHIALSSASIALAKALGGSSTALRRLGIIVPASAKGMDAIRYVAQKFAGQAEAGATSADHLRTSLVNAGETIGTALLPTFNRLSTGFSDWISKMDASGRLARDAKEAVSLLGDVFHTLEGVIHRVDAVTGGFKNTLKILIALELAKKAATWVTELRVLAETWGLVGSAATKAGAAQATALTESSAGGVAAGGSRIGALRAGAATAGSFLPIAALTIFAADVVLNSKTYKDIQSKTESHLPGPLKALAYNMEDVGKKFVSSARNASDALQSILGWEGQPYSGVPIPPGGPRLRLPLPKGGSLPFLPQIGQGGSAPMSTMFGNAQPMQQYWKQWVEGFKLTQAALMATLTKSNADDLAIARQIVAKVKKQIDEGLLSGPALEQALQAEASALGTIWAAEAAAAQKRAAKAAAAKQKIITQIQNAIDPINLQIAFAKADALGGNTTAVLRKQLAAAYKGLAQAIANGNKQLILQAYQQIKSIKDAIKSAVSTATSTFTVPAKLALDIARDQALGKGITDDLKEERRALYKWIASHRKNIQGVTDAYNQIAAINSQLNSDVVNAYGMFKKASVKALTENLGLTADQRRRLEERLSQRGPGGTTPGEGTGAAGYVIDPLTGRPVHAGHHSRNRRLQGSGGVGGGGAPVIHNVIDLTVNISGKRVEASVTENQQRRRRHNPTQTRGPNAATSVA